MFDFGAVLLIATVLVLLGAVSVNFLPTIDWRQEAEWMRTLGREVGGYVHDTAVSQYIPPNVWSYVTGTFTSTAGAVAGTIAINRAAANETSVITIPIIIPSNSVAQKGAQLKSIEIDYEIFTAEPTSMTPTVNKVTRGIDTAVAVVAAQTFTQSPSLANSITVEQHKLVLTITTPFWVDNDEYVLVQLSMVAGAGGNTTKFLGAVANYTLRI